MAIKERPQLILSDVMMPKISGFDLLDILRSTTETKNIRVIMMTALSSEDQRLRGEQLGADRYLVKSQVGIEDVVRVVHEILEDSVPAAAQAPQAPAPAQTVAPAPQPQQQPTAQPQYAPTTAPAPPQPSANPIPPPAGSNPLPVPAPAPVAQPPQARAKIITPLNDPTVGVNLTDLLNKEIAKEAGIDSNNAPNVASIEQAQAQIDSQIDQFANAPTIEEPVIPSDIPTVSVNADGTMSGQADLPPLPTPTPPPQPPQVS